MTLQTSQVFVLTIFGIAIGIGATGFAMRAFLARMDRTPEISIREALEPVKNVLFAASLFLLGIGFLAGRLGQDLRTSSDWMPLLRSFWCFLGATLAFLRALEDLGSLRARASASQ
jgi:hypothetical protein